MRAWWTLVKKELRTTLGLLYMPLGIVLLLGGFYVWLAYHHPTGVPSMLSIAGMMILVFYMPVYLLISSFREMKHTAHLWLHLPQSGWALLAAKIAAGAAQATVLYAVMFATTYWVMGTDVDQYVVLQDADMAKLHSIFREHGLLVYVEFLLISLYHSMWALLLFTSVTALKYQLGIWRWLAGVAVFIAPSLLTWSIDQAAVHFDVSLWGAFLTPQQNLSGGTGLFGQVVMGGILFYIVQVAALFTYSGWLLDRKVEV